MDDHSEAFVEAGEAAAARRSRRSIGPPNLLGDFSHWRQIFPPFSMLAACEILIELETYPSFSIIQLRRFFGTCRHVTAILKAASRREHPPSAIPTEAFLKFPFMLSFPMRKVRWHRFLLRSPSLSFPFVRKQFKVGVH